MTTDTDTKKKMEFGVANVQPAGTGFLKVFRADVTFDTFGGNKITKAQEVMERGDAVAIILFERDTESFLFTNQFRYPAAAKDMADGRENAGWMLEAAAGGLKPGEDPKFAVVREVEEELGYKLSDNSVKHISTFYVSPGGTSERLHLYYAEVGSSDKSSEGGGLKYEGEDIQLVKLTEAEAFAAIVNGEIRDAKTILGLQWFALNNVISEG